MQFAQAEMEKNLKTKKKPVQVIKDSFAFQADEEESKKNLRYYTEKGTRYVEFRCSITGDTMKIKNPRVPIGTSEVGLAELKYTEL